MHLLEGHEDVCWLTFSSVLFRCLFLGPMGSEVGAVPGHGSEDGPPNAGTLAPRFAICAHIVQPGDGVSGMNISLHG